MRIHELVSCYPELDVNRQGNERKVKGFECGSLTTGTPGTVWPLAGLSRVR